MMAELAGQALGGPYTLSGVPLILDDREWTDWMPPADHPLYGRFKQMETNWIGPLYSVQKQLLDAAHERQEIDTFVASFSAVRKTDGDLVSYCVWGEGIDSLLPVTEKVAIMRQGHEGPVAMADWDRVAEVAGDLMEPTDHYPPRYRVRRIPDVAAIEAIGKGAL
jgi:hypothetical protein